MLRRGGGDEQQQSGGVYGEVQIHAGIRGAREREGQLHGLVLRAPRLVAVREGSGEARRRGFHDAGGRACSAGRGAVRMACGWRVSGGWSLRCLVEAEMEGVGRVRCAMIGAGNVVPGPSAIKTAGPKPNSPHATLHCVTSTSGNYLVR